MLDNNRLNRELLVCTLPVRAMSVCMTSAVTFSVGIAPPVIFKYLNP